jgi:hypothetical protein
MTQTEPLTSGKDNPYAMGLMLLQYRGLPIVEHSGADAGYRANLLRFPEQHFSVVILCNTTIAPTALCRRVADLYLGPRFPKPVFAPFENDHEKLHSSAFRGKDGVYRSRSSGEVLRVGSEGGALQIIAHHHAFSLLSTRNDQFFLPQWWVDPLHFEPAEGTALHLVIQHEGRPPEIWDRMPEFFPDASAQKDYTGIYYSEELDASFCVEYQLGTLFLKRKKFAADELLPVAPNLFVSSIAVLRFTRNPEGHVSGMRLSTGHAWNLKFVRRADIRDSDRSIQAGRS